jgi:hypothetical protein
MLAGILLRLNSLNWGSLPRCTAHRPAPRRRRRGRAPRPLLLAAGWATLCTLWFCEPCRPAADGIEGPPPAPPPLCPSAAVPCCPHHPSNLQLPAPPPMGRRALMPLAMALMLPVASVAGATPPNLIFILADDLGHNVRPALVLLAYNCLLTSPGCLPGRRMWAGPTAAQSRRISTRWRREVWS